MNERIKEFLEQAISDVDYIRFTDSGEIDELLNDELSNMYIPNCFAEKFAELIVKECLSVQNKCPHDIAVGKFVRDHFGIEK